MADPTGTGFKSNQPSPSADERLDRELLAAGFQDARRARAILHALAGQGVTDDDVAKLLPNLLAAAVKSPDPDRALNNLERWTSRLSSRVTYFNALARSPSMLTAFFYLTGASQYFADLIIANPEYVNVLGDAIRGHPTNLHRSRQALQREVSNIINASTDFYQRMDSLRRLKQREMLRIGIRDILSLADMPETAREFSQLADVCIHETTRLAVDHLNSSGTPVELTHFAVIGMGKLGGEELNYSSDVDLIFIYSDQVAEQKQEAAYLKLAEILVDLLSKDTVSGRLFRVDTRLRPEGRFGSIARSMAGSRAYYESWAESWERQSLLKARTVGGGRQLGDDFMRMIDEFVYQPHISPRFLEEIQQNKRRIEKRAAIRNETDCNIKTGFGGIRDIEFAVQILQLEYGGAHPRIRCANTLRAITCLQQAGLLANTAARDLTDDYIWLRTLEHRLQLLYDLQTQKLPAGLDERRRLARRMNYPDLETFETDMERRRSRVHAHSDRIIFGAEKKGDQPSNRLQDLVDTIDDEASRRELGAWLSTNGFRETSRAFQILRTAAVGTEYGLSRPDVKQRFLSLAPHLLEAAARSPDPDNALLGIEELAQAVPNRAALYASLIEGSELMNRLIRLAACSPHTVKVLANHLEWLELLVSEEILEERPKRRAELLDALNRRLKGRKGAAFYDELTRFLLREWLRISARDVWDEVSWQITATDLTSVAESALRALLERVIVGLAPVDRESAESVAIIGMGKLGGRELAYLSDWDLLFVYDERLPNAAEIANRVAEKIVSAAPELRARSAMVEIDARLRPEGRFGALARGIDGYLQYYEQSAQTWERQALIRARPIAGSARTARRWLKITQSYVYHHPLSENDLAEIQAMKYRVETERVDRNSPDLNLKLGPGGMSDIEFLVQARQLQYGYHAPQCRKQNTIAAIRALHRCGALIEPDAAMLEEAYLTLNRLRGHLQLRSGTSSESLPENHAQRRPIALAWGLPDGERVAAEDRLFNQMKARMQEVRRIYERLFLHQKV